MMQPVSFDNDFECQNVVEEFTFEDEGEKSTWYIIEYATDYFVKFLIEIESQFEAQVECSITFGPSIHT